MSVRAGTQRGGLGGEASHREVFETAPDLVIGGEAQVAQLVQGGDPLRRRRATGHRQHPDRFNVAAAALRAAQRPTRQRGACRRDGIDRVGLAFPPADLPVRAVDLDHRDPGPVEMAGQCRPIRAGALHTDLLDFAMAAQPADQALIASLGRLERFDAEHPAEVIDHGRHMHLGMGVDTRGHRTCRLYDGHRHPFLLHWVQRGGTHLPGGCREPGPVGADPDHVPHPTGECRLRAGRRIVRETTRRCQPIRESDRPGDETDRKSPRIGALKRPRFDPRRLDRTRIRCPSGQRIRPSSRVRRE